MDSDKLSKASVPKSLGGYLTKLAKKHDMTDHAMGSVRTATHSGHQISLETMYMVKIDGKAVDISLMVGDDGQVHCHALPNYQFSSALDLLKVIVDQFPDAFPIKAAKSSPRKKIVAPKRQTKPKRGM